MKTESRKKHRFWEGIFVLSFAFAGICFGSCNDDNTIKNEITQIAPPNPNIPVEITEYSPTTGGSATKLVLSGSNFGTDTSYIRVTVNEKNARVVSSNGSLIYAIVPARADNGLVKLYIGKGDNVREYTYEGEFLYKFKQSVTTYIGNGEGTDNGHISEAKVRRPAWITFDKDGAMFFIDEGRGNNNDGGLRMVYEDQVTTFIRNSTGPFRGPRAIAFNVNQDTLFLANWEDYGAQDMGIGIFTRETGFMQMKPFIYENGVTTVVVHPKTNELFYAVNGTIKRLNKETKESEDLLNVAGGYIYSILFTPDGKTAYISHKDKHAIQKATYLDHQFSDCAVFAGDISGGRDEIDGQGTAARFNQPCQLALDEDGNIYVAGNEDRCIRKITPSGMVTTLAGLLIAGGSTDPGIGNQDGEPLKARFRNPQGIAVAPDGAIYVADFWNHNIRKILVE